MNLTIELPDELAATLEAQAQAQGVSAGRSVSQMLERSLALEIEQGSPGRPFETGRGMLGKYGQAPSAEEIDANRAEMFRSFAEDL